MSAASVALYNRWRDLMRSWGFTVLEAGGCDTQSASSRPASPGGMFLEHHDASSALSGNWGSLATILAGRAGIPPRLSNLQFARDGQVMIVCKNVANHGGVGGPLLGVPANDVNVHSCGAEVANNGLGEPYSPALTKAIVHGEAAWAIVTGRTADYVRGHKEWAPKRKTDPALDMNARRAQVAAVIANRGPLAAPAQEEDEMVLCNAYRNDPAQGGNGEIALGAIGTWWTVPDVGFWNLVKALRFCGEYQNVTPAVFGFCQSFCLLSEVNDNEALAKMKEFLSSEEAAIAAASLANSAVITAASLADHVPAS